MRYSSIRGPLFFCKGRCDFLGGTKGTSKGNLEASYRYSGGRRFCRECERYFSADLVAKMDRQIYCPCCGRKTSGRSRHGPNNMKVKMEKMLLVSR